MLPFESKKSLVFYINGNLLVKGRIFQLQDTKFFGFFFWVFFFHGVPVENDISKNYIIK